MTNREILLNLNDETKKYFDDAFSYLDYFTLNEDSFPNLDSEDRFAYSFLLSTLKNDSLLKKVFDSYEISFDRIYKQIGIKDTIKLHESEKTMYVKQNQLIDLFSQISSRLKCNNYLQNTDILLSELHPYQIFDFILENYYESIAQLFEKMGFNFDEDILFDICKKVYDEDCDFAQEHGVDLEDEQNKRTYFSREFEFDGCKITLMDDEVYIDFDRSFDFEDALISGVMHDKNIEERINLRNKCDKLLNKNRYKVEKISGFNNIDESVLERLFESGDMSDRMTLTLVEMEDPNKTFILTLNPKKAFKETIEDENQRIVRDILRTSDFDQTERHITPIEDTPYLDKYGTDLTKMKYLKDPSVDRESELKEIEKILLYPEKDKSIMITGIAGCGKTALVMGLAYRIQNGDVPKSLKDLRIISIEPSVLVAGTKYVGTLEEKMKNILEEASSSKNIILFIDEIHQTLGAGKSEGNDNSIAEILKPYLDYGRVRVIGATTDLEYKEYVTSNPAFETRFKQIKIKEPDEQTIFQIIDSLIDSYNKFADAKLNLPREERTKLINWLIDSTRARCRDIRMPSSNPRLVLDITKDAFAIAALDNRDEVTFDDFKNAIYAEPRLYQSCREDSFKRLEHMKTSKYKDNVIDFRLALMKR